MSRPVHPYLVPIGILLASRSTPQLDPATPEGAVQGYVQAVFDDDRAAARSFLTPGLAQRCPDLGDHHLGDHSASVVVVATDEGGDTVRIRVRFTETPRVEPLGGTPYSYVETFVLTEHGGRWLISDTPWPDHYCPEVTP